MAPERRNHHDGNILQRHPRATKVMAGIAIGYVGTSVALPHSVDDVHGKYVYTSPHLTIYPLFAENDGSLELFPFMIDIFPEGTNNPMANSGQQFQPTQEQQDAAIGAIEVRETKSATFACPDGSKMPYVSYGPMTNAELVDNLCGDVNTSAQQKRSKQIEHTAETPPSKPSKPGTIGTSKANGCDQYDGGDRIFCYASERTGNYYRFGGAHYTLSADGTLHTQSVAQFRAACPSPSAFVKNKQLNIAHGYPRDPHNDDYSGSPNPCSTDCSGLVRLAIADAFGGNRDWLTDGYAKDHKNWEQIPVRSAKRGDIVTHPGHVEIVDYMRGNVAHTVGSHATGTRTGPGVGVYPTAFHFIGKSSRH